MRKEHYVVFYQSPKPQPHNKLAVSSLYTLAVSCLLDKDMAITLFNIHSDAVMVAKVKGWFKRIIRVRRKNWV